MWKNIENVGKFKYKFVMRSMKRDHHKSAKLILQESKKKTELGKNERFLGFLQKSREIPLKNISPKYKSGWREIFWFLFLSVSKI